MTSWWQLHCFVKKWADARLLHGKAPRREADTFKVLVLSIQSWMHQGHNLCRATAGAWKVWGWLCHLGSPAANLSHHRPGPNTHPRPRPGRPHKGRNLGIPFSPPSVRAVPPPVSRVPGSQSLPRFLVPQKILNGLALWAWQPVLLLAGQVGTTPHPHPKTSLEPPPLSVNFLKIFLVFLLFQKHVFGVGTALNYFLYRAGSKSLKGKKAKSALPGVPLKAKDLMGSRAQEVQEGKLKDRVQRCYFHATK